LGENDIGNVKRVAKRLGVRDSDIIRFAIKSTLRRVAPLCDPMVCGRNLVPVLVESGDELIRYFELDAFRLEAIINDQAESTSQVDRDDIALLTMGGLREEYLQMRLNHNGAVGAAPDRSLRHYLYDKYIYRSGAPAARPIKCAPEAASSDDGSLTPKAAAEPPLSTAGVI
jgi:hypothetical protein